MRESTASLPKIVVDISVAVWASHPSGDTETDRTYTPVEVCVACKDALETIRDCGYKLAMTDDLSREWNSVLYKRCRVRGKPQSLRDLSVAEEECEKYARDWLVNMTSTSRIDVFNPVALGSQLPRDGLSRDQKKDAHLIESALGSDGRIVSHDKRVRAQWTKLLQEPEGQKLAKTQGLSRLSRLLWVDPELHKSLCRWLRKGAPWDPTLWLTGGNPIL